MGLPLVYRSAPRALAVLRAAACATTLSTVTACTNTPPGATVWTRSGVGARHRSWNDTQPDRRRALFAPHAVVASNSTLASQAGVEMLRQGGNAVDAAVAVGFALAVTLPSAGNIGGGGYMVIHMADGKAAALDYREVAPLAASRDMYAGPGEAAGKASTVGYRAVGVPGSVAGLCEALRKYGTLPLRVVMGPAIRLAEEGFVIDTATHDAIAGSRKVIAPFAGAAVFLPHGAPPPVGTRFTQPALARTLRLLAEQGAAAFYRGAVARELADDMRAHGGLITLADLARYAPVWRRALRGRYRGYTILGMPPSSSGGTTMIEALNILSASSSIPPAGSAAFVHVLASAFQHAFIDRNSELGDPAFTRPPVDRLTSAAYARQLRATIGDRHTPTPAAALVPEHRQTTHYSVVDRAGNAVSVTTTLNGSFGSGAYVASAGFMLNNEMDDFTSRPGTPNQFGLVMGKANAIAPGKRMLSSMSPTIVLDRAGKVVLVVGAQGGPRIITATAQVVLNVLERHMSLTSAMRAPRIHHQALPDVLEYEAGAITTAVADSLRAMGYTLKRTGLVGIVDAVMRVDGGYEGMDDPRHGARVAGY